MSEEKLNDDLKNYWDGETSLSEEEALFFNEKRAPELEAWATYVQQKKVKAPSHLQDSIWSAIENRNKSKKRMIYSLSGVAASILLVIAFFIQPRNADMGYAEKEALLEEALAMFPDENQKQTYKISFMRMTLFLSMFLQINLKQNTH